LGLNLLEEAGHELATEGHLELGGLAADGLANHTLAQDTLALARALVFCIRTRGAHHTVLANLLLCDGEELIQAIFDGVALVLQRLFLLFLLRSHSLVALRILLALLLCRARGRPTLLALSVIRQRHALER